MISIGAAVPERVLSNAELETIVDTSDEWITTRTGIKERRISAEGEKTSDYALKAAEKALENANLAPDDIDLIIVATVTGDMPFPSTASIVQAGLGVYGTPAFDLSAGCSGWVYGLACAKAYVASGIYKKVMVIGADLLSKVTNWTDRGTCILFGDGAGAGIVAEVEEGLGLLEFELGSDGTGAEVLKIEVGGSKKAATPEALANHEDKIFMEGQEVFKFAVRIQGDAIIKAIEKSGLTLEDIDLVIPHQANIRIIEAAVRRLGLPMDKFFVNLDRYGNTSAASIPIAIDEALREGKIKKGDNIVTVGFGAGLTWAAGVMKWAY
ncbi:MAG: beta-ketoacyl-ACP synthase III [Armatimonadota bacterium]